MKHQAGSQRGAAGVPHFQIAFRIGHRVRPRVVKEYFTCGGTSAKAVRVTMPSRSRVSSCRARTRSVILGIPLRSSLNLRSALLSMMRMSGLYRPRINRTKASMGAPRESAGSSWSRRTAGMRLFPIEAYEGNGRIVPMYRASLAISTSHDQTHASRPHQGLQRMRTMLAVSTALAAFAYAAPLGAQTPSPRIDSEACEPPLPGVITTCTWLDVGGRYRVRSIVTRPAAIPSGRLPAILFVQWLSCDPITVTADVNDGWSNVLRDLIQASGLVVVRTEKPGIGGSGGPSCTELGYDEELEVHRYALDKLTRSPDVHGDSIFVFGASMGGTMAPLLAGGDGVRGVIVAATTGATWLEHMIALDRRVMELRGMSPDSVHTVMSDHIRFHAAYLGAFRTPARIMSDWRGARSVWARMIGTDTTFLKQYGRPPRFHHQAQRQNWARAWKRLSVPVLVLHGANDWIMSEWDRDALLRALRARTNAETRYVDIPGMGHDLLVYGSLAESFRGRNGRFDSSVSRIILEWIRARRSAS